MSPTRRSNKSGGSRASLACVLLCSFFGTATAFQLKANEEENGKVAIAELASSASDARKQWSKKSFAEFKASVFHENFLNGKYIVDGDTAVSEEKQLREFFKRAIQSEGESGSGRLIRQAGADGIWNSLRKRQLSYCVSRLFATRHDNVVLSMQNASRAWEEVADIKFAYVASQDANCDQANTAVMFDVRPVDVGGRYLARSFFPNEPRDERSLLIDESSFHLKSNENLQLVGILRHELGHTLGWRHEQTRPEAGACFEDSNWVPLTSYDSLSVMHYPQCNGRGDWTLSLTAMDKSGAACAYGPAAGFIIDPSLISGKCVEYLATEPQPEKHTTKKFQASVGRGQEIRYASILARPGSIAEISVRSADEDTGDADLYVALGASPDTEPGDYICRPFRSGSNERCEITIQRAPRNAIMIMVRGYSAAKVVLEVSYEAANRVAAGGKK